MDTDLRSIAIYYALELIAETAAIIILIIAAVCWWFGRRSRARKYDRRDPRGGLRR
jgi:hypothetical protein